MRAGDRRRLEELVELGAAGRGRARRRVAELLPGRLRRRYRSGLVLRRHHRGRHLGRLGARDFGARRPGPARRIRLRHRATGDDGQRDTRVRAAAGDPSAAQLTVRSSPVGLLRRVIPALCVTVLLLAGCSDAEDRLNNTVNGFADALNRADVPAAAALTTDPASADVLGKLYANLGK